MKNYNLKRKSKQYDLSIAVNNDTYAGIQALPYLTPALKAPDTIAKGYVRTIDGLTDKAVLNNISSTDPVTAGGTSNCGWTAGSNLSTNEQVLTLIDLKVNEEICRASIFPTWMGQGMDRNGNLPQSFGDFLLQVVAGRVAQQLENGIWVSDNSNGAGVTGLWGEGFVSNDGTFDATGWANSATASFSQVTMNTGTATDNTNIDTALSGVFDEVVADHPGLMDKAGFGFYMNNKMYGFYAQYLANSGSGQGINMLGTNQDMQGFTYLGYPIYRCPGMPDECIVATYPENLVVGSNTGTDWQEVRMIPKYEFDGSDNIGIAMRFAMGVQVGIATDGVIGGLF